MTNETTKKVEVSLYGIKRTLDKDGRFVIPKEMRDSLGVTTSDEMEIFQTQDGFLITVNKLKT